MNTSRPLIPTGCLRLPSVHSYGFLNRQMIGIFWAALSGTTIAQKIDPVLICVERVGHVPPEIGVNNSPGVVGWR